MEWPFLRTNTASERSYSLKEGEQMACMFLGFVLTQHEGLFLPVPMWTGALSLGVITVVAIPRLLDF